MSAVLAHLFLFSSALIGYFMLHVLYRCRRYRCTKNFPDHDFVNDHSGYGLMSCKRCGENYSSNLL